MSNAKLKAKAILKILERKYPKARIALKFKTNMELLVATILSAQCTDKRVNIVTKRLFEKYKKVSDYARAIREDFENDIRTTGFFRNKAKNIIKTACIIEQRFKGRIPQDMEGLTRLPGIARKTANIILYNGFGKNEGIAVDTHVRRLSQRIGLSKENNPVKIEQGLMHIVPKHKWGYFSGLFIEHGRKICVARKPLCLKCSIKEFCEYFLSKQKNA